MEGSAVSAYLSAEVASEWGLAGRRIPLAGGGGDNASSAVGARLSVSGDMGVARGTATGRPLDLDLIDLDTQIAVGEPVVTSGLQGSRFPPGIPLGRVLRVRPGTIHQKVSLRPVVDIERTVYISVLLWTGQ